MRRLVVLAGVVALSAASSAGAGRPEPNGEIAFVSDRRGADNLYVLHADGSGIRELTHSFAAASHLNVSRDRKHVAYVRMEGPESVEIWSATTSGRRPRRIVAAGSLITNTEPFWSPDGRRLAFIRQDSRQDVSVASAFVANADGTGLRRVTPAGREVTEPAWSPDGRWIAVSDKYSPTVNSRACGIALVSPDGSGFRKVPIRGRMCATDPTWSPDSGRIAFAGGEAVYVVGADGRHVRRVAHRRDTFIEDPEWSPDGRHIAFSLGAYEGGGSGIYVVTPAGKGLRLLVGTQNGRSPSWTSGRELLFTRNGSLWRARLGGRAVRIARHRPATSPTWSPDGTALAFTAPSVEGDPNLYELAPVGGPWRTILGSWRKDSQPSWSPDGQRFAFTRGDRFVWTARRGGRGQKRIAEGIDPDWSPDGRRLAYTVLALWTINVDGTGRRRLTPGPTLARRADAEWSPDGSRISFTRVNADSSGANVYVINGDGTGLRLMIRNAHEAAWSPDGRFVAFVRNGDIWVRRLADGQESLLAGGPHREHSPAWGRAGP